MADQPADAQAGSADKPDDLTGHSLGDFEMIRRLGRGGMGEVYLARQKSLKRQVAVKILRTELAANVTALKRFKAEAETVARINHANIVQVYAIGEERGLHFIAMEYVEGRNLKEYMAKKGTPDLPIALNIMRQIAAALTRASELGFVHRDIKPENILLTRKGEVKVADFGLSRSFVNTDQALNITQSGVTMGTPLYMSPEQVQGRTVDPRSDIYSFGVTCYHMLKGEPPFRGATAFEVAIQHVQNEPPYLPEARPDLPVDLCLLVHKMMAKKPEARCQTAREVLRELNRIREGLPLANPPAPLAATQVVPGVGVAGQSGSQTAMMPVGAPVPRWLAPLAGLAAAAGLGVGLNAIFPLPHADAGKETPFEMPATLSPARKRIAELQASLNSSGLRLEVAYENLLDLAMLHVRERQFDEAMQLLDPANLNKRAALADTAKGRDPAMGRLGMVSMLGKGIVLAAKDDPKASLDTFHSLQESMKAKKGIPAADPMRPIDEFLKQNPSWKRGVADALERDAVNLGSAAKLDPAWENHRSYLPKFVPPLKPKDK